MMMRVILLHTTGCMILPSCVDENKDMLLCAVYNEQSDILLMSRLHPLVAAVSCQENDGWKAEETIEKGGRVYTCSNGGKGKRCLLRILL